MPSFSSALAEERALDLQAELHGHVPPTAMCDITNPSIVGKRGSVSFGNPLRNVGGNVVMTETINPVALPEWEYKEDRMRNGPHLWDKAVLPLDFSMTDFSDLEEKTRALYRMEDGWMYQDEANPILKSEHTPLNPRQPKLDQWWERNHPAIADRIIPFGRNVMSI